MTAAVETLRQSRIGKRPVSLPKGVEVSLSSESVLRVKGPKGELTRQVPELVEVVVEGDAARVDASRAGRDAARLQGLVYALLKNNVQGVSEGYKVALDLHGVGYRAELKGDSLSLALGLSHIVVVTVPVGIEVKIETIDEGGTKRPRIHLSSSDKEALGQFRSKIRALRPPEPYKGKGVRVVGERIREKAGKAGAKGK